MLKEFITSIKILACLILVAPTAVRAQTNRQFVIQIPFDFIVAGRKLPSGKYSVQRSDPTRPNVLMLKRTNNGIVQVFLTQRVEGDDTCPASSLIFKQHGGDFYLLQVWMLGDRNGNQLSLAEKNNRRDQRTNLSKIVRVEVSHKRP